MISMRRQVKRWIWKLSSWENRQREMRWCHCKWVWSSGARHYCGSYQGGSASIKSAYYLPFCCKYFVGDFSLLWNWTPRLYGLLRWSLQRVGRFEILELHGQIFVGSLWNPVLWRRERTCRVWCCHHQLHQRGRHPTDRIFVWTNYTG